MKYLQIVILFFACSVYANAQDVEDICKTHVEKLGGISNISKIENIYIEQTIFSNNIEVPQTTLIIPGKMYYQEINFPNGKNIICVLNGAGWTINHFVSAKSIDLNEKEVNNYLINSNIFGPLYDYYLNGKNSSVNEITLEGEKTIDRDNCYKLKVFYKSGFVAYVYVSKKSYMIRKSESTIGSMICSDYQKANKVMFPYNTEITNVLGVMRGTVINLKTNIKIDYDKFKKP